MNGVWLGASHILRRPAPVDEPYPHICRFPLPSRIRLGPRDCAACAEQRQNDKNTNHKEQAA